MYWVPGRRRLPYDAWTSGSHFAERFELFMIIAFEETIVLTGATTSGLELDAARFTAFALAFVGTAALWWLYFDGFPTIARRRLGSTPNGSTARARRVHVPPCRLRRGSDPLGRG